MKNKLYGYFSVFCYVVSFLILLFCINVKLIPNFYLNTRGKLLLLSIVCILLSAVFVIGLAEPLKATSIQDEKDKQEELQNKIDDVETIIEELEK